MNRNRNQTRNQTRNHTRNRTKLLQATVGTVVAGALVAATAVLGGTAAAAPAAGEGPRPTIVLVHGGFEDASAFSGVVERLQRLGYQVVAPANPLRGLAEDTAYLADVVRSVGGPVVLVGHSYGGMVISQVAAQVPDVRALVYASAFIPAKGESVGELNSLYPGSLLGPDTTSVLLHATGGPELLVKPAGFRAVFAGDRTARDAAVAAAGQRPVAANTLSDRAEYGAPASVPAYAVISTEDKAIPPAVQEFMADRAHARTWRVRSAHDITATHPALVASVVEQAARNPR
ncbi:alpha/beta fold hydrolase [Kitasatospora sp. NPDC057223]|uniref:alpha/beta fold hydrolase n=1 Tax=Kitasatospora sp. NPDC057223 TaxID=3346055 RepID=UPI00363371B9